MRGYSKLRNANQFCLVRKIKREIACSKIDYVNKAASKLFFGEASKDAELIIRQYLANRLGGIGLNKAILYSIGKGGLGVVYPLPKHLQAVLERNEIKVFGGLCSVLWYFYLLIIWFFGVMTIFKHFYIAIKNLFLLKPRLSNKFLFFIGLTRNNLPQLCNDYSNYNLISWIIKHKCIVNDNLIIRHDVIGVDTMNLNGIRIEYDEYMIPILDFNSRLINFIGWAIYAVIYSIFELFQGRWWSALLLSEASKASVVRYSNNNKLASNYFFQNSVTFYRPMWTYEAENRGSQITSYFYSISEEFKLPKGYEPISSYWELMNWPIYLVWDKYQENFIRQNVQKFSLIKIVGPIPISDSPRKMPAIPNNSAAIFDIQPIRSSSHFGFSTMSDLGYPNHNVQLKFIEDIYSVLSSFNLFSVHKRKRSDDSRTIKKYKATLDKLSDNKNFISIDPSISAARVIENCQIVISMPFTSTAIIGEFFGKPSIYYDPVGAVQKDDVGAHGIPIISGKEELKAWLSSILSKTKIL
jgi:polysaccharide biosynthesis PFTS motif protein